MTPRSKQHGFTLVELMIASVLGLLILASAFGILYQSIGFVELMRSRAILNAHARQSLDLLLDGGVTAGTAVYGLRGLNAAPAPLRDGYRIKLTNNGGTLRSARVASIDVTCVGVNDPLPDCVGIETLTVDGYVGDDPALYGDGEAERSVADQTGTRRTRELQVILFDAYRLRRDEDLPGETGEVYRTIFTYNLD